MNQATLFGYPFRFTIDVDGHQCDLAEHLKEDQGTVTLDLDGVLNTIHLARTSQYRPSPFEQAERDLGRLIRGDTAHTTAHDTPQKPS